MQDPWFNVLANIVGGVVAAMLLGIGALIVDWRKHRIMQELIEIMGRAVHVTNAPAVKR
jgi:hypothetical protein